MEEIIMPTKEIQKFKDKTKKQSKFVKSYMSELKKHQEKPKYDNLKTDVEDKVNGIEYYNNLTESEKVAFQRQVQLKKVRDN